MAELKESSSGGVFSIIAGYILEQRGLVVGCVFDDSFCATHIIASTQNELSKMRGSKYVQSDLADTYSKVKSHLLQNKTVLFTGTPCQIDGLYRFLGKDNPNLTTIDLICHGVPSPSLFQTYLSYLQKRENGRLIDYRFRNKARNGWVSQGSFTIQKGNRYITKNTSPFNDYYYYYYYLKNAINRMNCYSCPYAKPDRIGDFSIGDYWNIQDIHPEFDCSSGASLLLVNSAKASHIFDVLKDRMLYLPTDIAAAKKENSNLYHTSTMPSERLTVYTRIRAIGFRETAKEDCKLSYFVPILRKLIPRPIKNFIKRLR
jgi:coenzyme F420-reducing hydrogenase beta subunit